MTTIRPRIGRRFRAVALGLVCVAIALGVAGGIATPVAGGAGMASRLGETAATPAPTLRPPPGLAIVDPLGEALPAGTVVTTVGGPVAGAGPGRCPATPDASPPVGEALAAGSSSPAATPGAARAYPVIADAADIAAVAVRRSERTGMPVVQLTFTAAGARKMARFTERHIGEPLSLVLDGRVLSTPVIAAVISTEVEIAGLDEESLRMLVVRIRDAKRCA